MYSRGIDGAPTVLPGVKPADQIGQYVNTTMNAIFSFVDGYLSKKKIVNIWKLFLVYSSTGFFFKLRLF